jgi:hypothetical protein
MYIEAAILRSVSPVPGAGKNLIWDIGIKNLQAASGGLLMTGIIDNDLP